MRRCLLSCTLPVPHAHAPSRAFALEGGASATVAPCKVQRKLCRSPPGLPVRYLGTLSGHICTAGRGASCLCRSGRQRSRLPEAEWPDWPYRGAQRSEMAGVEPGCAWHGKAQPDFRKARSSASERPPWAGCYVGYSLHPITVPQYCSCNSAIPLLGILYMTLAGWGLWPRFTCHYFKACTALSSSVTIHAAPASNREPAPGTLSRHRVRVNDTFVRSVSWRRKLPCLEYVGHGQCYWQAQRT